MNRNKWGEWKDGAIRSNRAHCRFSKPTGVILLEKVYQQNPIEQFSQEKCHSHTRSVHYSYSPQFVSHSMDPAGKSSADFTYDGKASIAGIE